MFMESLGPNSKCFDSELRVNWKRNSTTFPPLRIGACYEVCVCVCVCVSVCYIACTYIVCTCKLIYISLHILAFTHHPLLGIFINIDGVLSR